MLWDVVNASPLLCCCGKTDSHRTLAATSSSGWRALARCLKALLLLRGVRRFYFVVKLPFRRCVYVFIVDVNVCPKLSAVGDSRMLSCRGVRPWSRCMNVLSTFPSDTHPYIISSSHFLFESRFHILDHAFEGSILASTLAVVFSPFEYAPCFPKRLPTV